MRSDGSCLLYRRPLRLTGSYLPPRLALRALPSSGLQVGGRSFTFLDLRGMVGVHDLGFSRGLLVSLRGGGGGGGAGKNPTPGIG
jgi:hypothetical protein